MERVALSASIVICARDAEATLAEALGSVLAQTAGDWEALVVHDPAEDSTASVARDFARRDPRFRLIADAGAEVASAARNRGLAEAQGGMVLFLDGASRLAPAALESLRSPLMEDPSVTAAHGGWRRVAGAGALSVEHGPTATDLFPYLARRPVLALHACLARTDAVRAAGGFDEGLPVAEGWDLWQRVARAGARFSAVPCVVCDHRVQGGSLSDDARRSLVHGLAIIRAGHSSDARVSAPAAAWEQGLPREQAAEAQLGFLAWTAGLLLGRGEDAVALLEEARGPASGLSPEDVGELIAESGPLGAGADAAAWPELWAAGEPAVDRFLEALERHAGARRLATRARRHLEAAAVRRAGGTAVVGRAHSVRVEATAELADLPFPRTAERVVATVTAEEEPLGVISLPVCDGMVTAEVLADAVADAFWWPLLGRFFGATIYRGAVDHDELGWELFLQELWGTPGRPTADFYPPAASRPGRLARLRTVKLQLEVSERLPDPPRGPCDLQLIASVGGRAIASVRAPDGSADAMRGAVTRGCGTELCRAAVREGVLGRPFSEPGTLRARLAQRAAEDPREPAGLVLGRHAAGPVATSASRRARLPSEAGEDLAAAARAAGEPVLGRHAGDVTYAPERLWQLDPDPRAEMAGPDAPGERRHRFEALFASAPDPSAYTSPYERTKYEQTLSLTPERGGHALELACAEGHFTTMLAPRCESLVAADISEVALARAAERCAEHPNVSFRRLDIAGGELPGGFDLVCCSEVLYFAGERSDLPAVAERLARALAPEGMLVTTHSHALVDDPGEPGFDWQVPFGAKAITEALAACPLLAPVRELRAPYYRVSSFRRVDGAGSPAPAAEPIEAAEMPEAVARRAHAGDGSVVVEYRASTPSTAALPILMYHRIDTSGDRWSVSPEAFAEQITYLVDAGYRSVTFDEWRQAVERRKPLPGRAVILTFDDGYRDFAENAWPVLQRHGLGATVFVVTDHVGGVNAWDAGHEREHELLGWDEIAELSRAGVDFGAHTATHPHLMACTPGQAASETARSRHALTERLGKPPTAFAYPFGDQDAAVAHLVGACGFAYGVTIRSALATRHDSLLRLPRIEATGGSLASFVASLG